LQSELRDIEPDSVIPIPQIDSSYGDDAITDASDMVDTESLTGAVVWLVPASKMLMALGSLESLALYMPMENRYKFIFMHEGDLGSPVYQQEVKDQWLERAHQIEESNAPLAAKMRAMGEDIEFMLVDLHVPNDVAQLARAGEFKDVIYGNRWPGTSPTL
jgi:hypothetical protein